MQNKTVVSIVLALFMFLFACSSEKTPHERLQGIWDIDDKASWEYQKPGEPYALTIAELQRDISLQFDTKEQVCRVLNVFGNYSFRYRVISEEKDKIALVIGKNTFVFEFQSDDRILFCPLGGGVVDCRILVKGNTSTEADRQAKAESRLATIIKRHTQNVASRTEQFIIRALLDPGERIADADIFRAYATEFDAFKKGKSKDAGRSAKDSATFMTTMLRDIVQNSSLQYARVYTSNGTMCLSSDINAPQPSAMQHKFILNAAKTGNPGPIALIANDNKLLFELYLPIYRPFVNDGKEIVGVLALARPMYPFPDECFTADVSIPEGSLYFIRYTGQNYQIIGTKGVKAEVQELDLTDDGEMPFARRKSLMGDSEVYSQASHGPATNSWVLLETDYAYQPGK